MMPRNTAPPKSQNHLIYDNAAVGHQLAMDRNDMLVPGKQFVCACVVYLYRLTKDI